MVGLVDEQGGKLQAVDAAQDDAVLESLARAALKLPRTMEEGRAVALLCRQGA